jgi:hypothetical protein
MSAVVCVINCEIYFVFARIHINYYLVSITIIISLRVLYYYNIGTSKYYHCVVRGYGQYAVYHMVGICYIYASIFFFFNPIHNILFVNQFLIITLM